MHLLVSQNLYGLLGSPDGTRFAEIHRHPVLANGLCAENGRVYLADWSDVLALDHSGRLVERVPTKAQNVHTLRRHDGRFLIASTADASVVWGDEVVFRPQNFGFRPVPPHGFYLNSAVPYRDSTILIGLRSHRAVVFFDVEKRKVERVIALPWLKNLHHPTGFGPDLFFVSDDSSVVLFGIDGKPLLRSPEIRWPRGIWVESRTRVWVADRRGISRINFQTNRIERRIDSPLNPPSSLPERAGDVPAGALFDVCSIPS